ncbi:MAG: nitroreductase family protein [Clostridiales Family XIII bacterium]|jgi:nitroreductase|nr:nitroreductase family protein [Clostridiales Family XIII bacterium]
MDNAILDFLKSRRSTRKFKSEQISDEILEAVLEAGTYAPTGKGAQCPVIVAVQDPETHGQLIRMNARILGSNGDPYYGAPTILVILAPKTSHTYIEDASCVNTYLQLAAHAAGLGSVWVHREKEMFETEGGKALLKKWGLSEDMVGIGAVALGYADCDPPAPAVRKKDYVIRI